MEHGLNDIVFLCSKTYGTLQSCHNFHAGSRQAAWGARICETSLLAKILVTSLHVQFSPKYSRCVQMTAVCKYFVDSFYFHVNVLSLTVFFTDASSGSNEAWVSRQTLQDLYQTLLVMDLEYALDKKVEQDLWVYQVVYPCSAIRGLFH